MNSDQINRRAFLNRCGIKAAKASTCVGLIGMRFHAYGAATIATCGYSGWVTWFGRCVAYVPADGGKWFWWFSR